MCLPRTTICDKYSGGSVYNCFLFLTPLHLSTLISRFPVLTDTVTGAGGRSHLGSIFLCSYVRSCRSILCSRCSRRSCSSADVTSSPSWSSTTPESSRDDCWLLLLLACLECNMPRCGANLWTVLTSGGFGVTAWSGRCEGRTFEWRGLGLGLGVTDL